MSAFLDRLQQRHPWAGFPLAVVYKYLDDQGGYLAALVAYYGFLSIFPLLLLLSSLLGFVLDGDPALQQRILHSAVGQVPLIGDQLLAPAGLHGSLTSVVIGLVASLYGGLGVAQAGQHAMNTAWAVPRRLRPNPLAGRARGLLLLGTAGVAILGTTVLTALGGYAGALGTRLTTGIQALVILLSLALTTGILLAVFRLATACPTTVRQNLPGAMTAALVWQLLQTFGTLYVRHAMHATSRAGGVFALVLGLVAWLYLAAVAVLLSVEINVVRAKRLYPRSLLTPFTDNVDLTSADRDAYTDAATAQQVKGFESVDVSFAHEGQNATARRNSPDQDDSPLTSRNEGLTSRDGGPMPPGRG